MIFKMLLSATFCPTAILTVREQELELGSLSLIFNPFMTMVAFYIPIKHRKTTSVFKGYRKTTGMKRVKESFMTLILLNVLLV